MIKLLFTVLFLALFFKIIYILLSVRQIFRDEKQYYELLVDKSVKCLCLFPYHLADIVSKGLRVTPFNYYIDVLCYLLRNDKSYDTLPNFTAADCTLIFTTLIYYEHL